MADVKMYPCQYRIIRFVPFSETEEFANIGIVLFCPVKNEFLFQIAPKRFGRVTSFFDDLDPVVYKSVIDSLRKEFKRVKTLIEEGGHNQSLNIQVFREATRNKSGLLSMSDIRVLVTDDTQAKLQELYNHFIERDFQREPSREVKMIRQLKKTLKAYSLDGLFKERVLSDGFHEANFPLVRMVEDRALGAIRPMAFDQKSKSKVVDSADLWEARLKNLTQNKVVEPERVFVPVELPMMSDVNATKYVESFIKRLKGLGIEAAIQEDIGSNNDFFKRQASAND